MKTRLVVVLIAALVIVTMGVSAAADGPVTSLNVHKTATGHWDRYLDWTLEKDAVPESADLFVGDEQEIRYDVTVSQVGYTDIYRVSGEIEIVNDCSDSDDKTAFIDYVDDALEYRVGNDWVEFHRERIRDAFTIETCGTETVPYDFEFVPPAGVTEFRNVAYVGLSNHAPPPGEFKDFIYRVTFDLPAAPTLYDECVEVNDSYEGYLGQVCGEGASETFTYYRTVSYDTPGTYLVENTATADGQEVTKTVTITVWDLDVTKDADTSFNRYWAWTIDKSGDQSDLMLSVGQMFLVNYAVTVDATFTDDDFEAWGDIYVENPAPIAATINAVEDVLDGMSLDVDCGDATFPYSLPAGGTLHCTYSADLPDADPLTNVATAWLQNYAYDYMGNGTATGETAFTGEADVVFGTTPADQIDECIYVSDDKYGDLGNVCADQVPYNFYYGLWVGPYDVCGFYQFTNVASFVTDDTGTTGEDSWTVNVNVPCEGGCTLTQGYWKTHSEYGPAPYDDTWASLPDGADTAFFGTGYSYYEILWMPPKKGNTYLILAHQYIAAELNVLNGADMPYDVQAAWDEATTLLADNPDMDLKGADARDAKSLAALLDDYNNGLIGPGHCSE
jgi:hypothetical protein